MMKPRRILLTPMFALLLLLLPFEYIAASESLKCGKVELNINETKADPSERYTLDYRFDSDRLIEDFGGKCSDLCLIHLTICPDRRKDALRSRSICYADDNSLCGQVSEIPGDCFYAYMCYAHDKDYSAQNALISKRMATGRLAEPSPPPTSRPTSNNLPLNPNDMFTTPIMTTPKYGQDGSMPDKVPCNPPNSLSNSYCHSNDLCVTKTTRCPLTESGSGRDYTTVLCSPVRDICGTLETMPSGCTNQYACRDSWNNQYVASPDGSQGFTNDFSNGGGNGGGGGGGGGGNDDGNYNTGLNSFMPRPSEQKDSGVSYRSPCWLLVVLTTFITVSLRVP